MSHAPFPTPQTLAAFLITGLTSAAASAFPSFGSNAQGNCFACHDVIQVGRMEAFGETGMIDPDELPGLPDPGPLKYFTVEQGGSSPVSTRAVDGEENYAFQIKGFEDPDVTASGTLLYSADAAWDAFDYFNLVDRTYYSRSDGPMDGYDWGTGDPTEVDFNITVSDATNPGYYLLTLALGGRDPDRLGWYQEELVYLEVTNSPEVIDLVSTDLVRGQPAGLRASEATPNSTVYFVYSLRGTGETSVPQLGVTLALANPSLAGSARADAAGVAILRTQVPPAAPSIPVWLQAAQVGRVSNIIATEIQ